MSILEGENFSVKDAERIFKCILKDKKIDSLRMDGEGSEVKLKIFNIEKALLPSWMLRSDEISVACTGKRLWNVVYKGDVDSLLGFSAVSNKGIHDASYDDLPVATKDEVSFSVRYLICVTALCDRLDINWKNKSFTDKPCSGFYSNAKVTSHGEIVKFNSEDNIVAFQLNKIVTEQSVKNDAIRLLKINEYSDITI